MTTWLNVKNNAQSALYAGITAAATSLTLLAGEGSKFPSSNFNISIDDEILLCTTRTVDVLTVTRAQEGTTAAIHAVGATVTLNVTAGIISQIQTAIDAGGGGGVGREMLTANRTYYVRTDGNDSNTGLINSAAGAFLTIQKAVDAAAALDIVIYDITIQVGAGTYTIASFINLKSMIGSGLVTIIGDETTPTNVIVDGNNAGAIFKAIGITTTYYLKGMQIKSSTANTTIGIHSSTNSNINFQKIDFGAGLTQQLRCDDGGRLVAIGNYSISGGAAMHLVGVGGLVRIQTYTITLSGTPAFTTFVDAGYLSLCLMNSLTFAGLATGVRYAVAGNSVLYTGAGGANYFPGNIAGSAATGGQYL